MGKSYKSLSNYSNDIQAQQNNKPLTREALITEAIAISERLIIEVKDIEEKILTPTKNYNNYTLLIIGAYFKSLTEDIINIKQNNLKP